MDQTLRPDAENNCRFVDVAHGAIVIEYEPPKFFVGIEGANLRHAQKQAADYALLLHNEEGRSLQEYVLVAWDGSHICFGRYEQGDAIWERLSRFNVSTASRILLNLKENGIPIVNPRLLSSIVGPESKLGAELIPIFFQSIRASDNQTDGQTNKTNLLFREWRRLFGQVVGIQSEHLKDLLKRQGDAHHQPYSDNPVSYLFALNTYIALVAKLVAALSIPNGSQDLTDANVPIASRVSKLESGTLFADAGVLNMLVGEASTRAANAGALVGMLGANILDLKTTLRQCLILGVITKDALVPLADAEAEAALDEFEKSLMATIRAKEAQLADMAASQAKIAQAQATAKPSAETLARGGAGLPAAG